jgi:YegS/Rv2252/BmrU family lipid kinase
MQPINVTLIFNPRSGLGRSEDHAVRLQHSLRENGIQANLIPIDALKPADTSIDSSHAHSAERLPAIILGGDGTVRSVVEHMLNRHAKLASTPPPVLIVPTGTANLVARHVQHRWPKNPLHAAAEIARTIRGNSTRRIDVARVNGRVMLAMCGVGFDADVVHDLADRRRGAITKLSYLRPIARRLVHFKPSAIQIDVDGQRIFEGTATAIAANMPEYGAGFSVTPHAQSDDRLLDLTILPMSSSRHAIGCAIKAARGQLMRSNAISLRGSHVHIHGDAKVQIDGEPFGELPAEIKVEPVSIEIFTRP